MHGTWATKKISICLVFFLALFGFTQLWAQGELIVSKNADFSTDDRVFSRDDSMYMKVIATDVDFTDIDDNEFRLKPDDDGNDIEGSFTNNFDGTYQAKIGLASADPTRSNWQLRARIKDESGIEFRAAVEILIPANQASEEIEVKGTIESINLIDSILVVRGVTFDVTATTDIRDDEDRPILLSDLSQGNGVEIRGVRVGQTIQATTIKVDDDGIEEGEIEVTGTVTEVGADFLVVVGFTFQVNEATAILDDNENNIPFFLIKAGLVVEVHADVLSNGTLLATKIKIEDRFDDEVEITGIIQSINLSDSTLVVGDFEVIIIATTQILDDDNNPIDFSDLRVGMVVEFEADVQADGRLFARKIKIEDRFEDEVEITGTIELLGSGSAGDSLVVAGITFFVDVNTTILDDNNNPIGFGNLQLGDLVEIRAIEQADGRLVATQIKIEDRIEDEVEIAGVIEKITITTDKTSITVLGRTFLLTANSVILNENEVPITIDMLFVGQVVEVRGDLLPDGTLIAIRIKREDRDATEIDVIGPIDSFDASGPKTVEVVGIIFFVTDTTTILDKSNNPISFGELELGQTVEIRALGQPNGTRVATRIKVEDVLLLSGIVDRVVFNGVSLLGKDVLFDSNTLVLGKDNVFLSLQDLAQGQFVEVRAKQNGNNSVFGTKVKIQLDGVITSVESPPDDDVVQPSDFVLLRNYPNPFNPETTITFQVPQSSNHLLRTQVTVYNLLGQAVRRLVDEQLSAGIYQRRWDGRGDNGNAMPTGVYLYQLKAGALTKTERMLLVK